MNVLLTCVGRRNYMVEYFREALNGRGQVYAANSYAETAGMAVAESLGFKAFDLRDAGPRLPELRPEDESPVPKER